MITNRIQLLCAKLKIPVNRINNNAELATVPIKIQGLNLPPPCLGIINNIS